MMITILGIGSTTQSSITATTGTSILEVLSALCRRTVTTVAVGMTTLVTLQVTFTTIFARSYKINKTG